MSMIHLNRTRGYSLIEVLVALVIISIGVIGIAAMQATALSGTHTSQTESIAAIEARSLADAMLANPAFWDSGAAPTASVTIASSTSITGSTALTATTDCGAGSNCSASDLAAYDVQHWATEYFQQVPNAKNAVVACNTTTPPVCTIQLNWTQKASAAINGGTQSTATGTTVTYTLVNQF
ncbi:type IV pilus modification protein PilV [Dyella acidiphila]|uniref:Type IV pilus modification protein PilV n=1 Tax=Dyella acidiphila TaxID=2775866 RepID=A0ABR9G7R1_9GAMM|nr:type IV pilus modification protein PilV [Dyella acidiphila]MBE1160071.1 type IV pilus modification protein PilV [Dyella acidiphila]